MRAAVAHIYSVDIMATFLLLSQPRTSTKNVRLAVPQALLSVGNVAETLFGCMAGPTSGSDLDFWVKCQLCSLPPPSTCISPCGFHFRAAAHLLLVGFSTTLWVGWPSERCLTQANKQYPLLGRAANRNADFQSLPTAPYARIPLCASLIGDSGTIPERNVSSLHIWTRIFVRHDKESLKSILTRAVRQAL